MAITGTVPSAHVDLIDMPEPVTFAEQTTDHDPRYNIIIDGGQIGITPAMALVETELVDGGEL